ncbi:nitroreductase family protein [Fibrobacter sp. UWB11]|uniref:nitroreductase family protein n=1 Tax=Fibrobacter sp. UWB11 TaxID=1896202 RepID=UPI00092B20AF|nr:nitroreductase family protein [Fibrobacter sp. UWB11]SIO28260.1 Putative TM nitroreductase [Fibrobacter sp. UWB11]
MTLDEAVFARHSVRRYRPDPLTKEQVEELQAHIRRLNETFALHMQLIVNDDVAFSGRLAHYGSFRNVKNYIAVAGQKSTAGCEATLDERAGYAAAELVLLAQTLGLNTCVVGLTFKKTPTIEIDDGEKLELVIAIGYGETQGVQHPMKPVTRIAPDYDKAPDWFKKGIDYVMLAPSALNQFKAKFTIDESGRVFAKHRLAYFSKVDLGIFKYFFELGAGKEIFRRSMQTLRSSDSI